MSIPLRPAAFGLPDFRNQGVWLRILLAVNVVMFAIALVGNRQLERLPQEVAELAALVEPAALASLSVLFLLAQGLRRLSPRVAGGFIVLIVVAIATAVEGLLANLLAQGMRWRTPLAAGTTAGFIILWFDLVTRARAPALAEARLAALTARIRPHFFFNSLNAVLGILRTEPRRAETALEELADLFRVLMRDNRDLWPLSEEIALARKYIEIEYLRLGERLKVTWELAACPPDALAPPLLLQPLLENAVYHGIEPALEPGEIQVRIAMAGDMVRIEIDNPCPNEAAHRIGNHMALDNLHERLMLFYDLEAKLETRVADGRYQVRVDLPRRRQP